MDPSITVVGLGPAGEEYFVDPARRLLAAAPVAFLRTARHPAAAALGDIASFDRHYEEAESFDEVYARIVADLVTAAQVAATAGDGVVYAVPGSPLVAERTVELLRADPRVTVHVVPAVSFLDLAWARLGIDPVQAGVRVVDAARFSTQAAGERGPMLVAQCWSPATLSEIKLAFEDSTAREERTATILFHLGLPDEVVVTVPWHDLDRAVAPDHLTSVWIPELAAPVGAELVALDELARRLRAECPWDRQQTHESLSRYLLEESYEAIDAIDALTGAPGDDLDARREAARHLEEELGDVLFQVYFHSRLAAEEGWFTLADVARGVHDKLVSRHPHVFADVVVRDASTVTTNWEEIKKAEKGRESVTEGIPSALPALALASKLQRKAAEIPGVPSSSVAARGAQARALLERLMSSPEPAGVTDPSDAGTGLRPPDDREAAELLWAVADLVRQLGIEPEDALRVAARRFAAEVREAESAAREHGTAATALERDTDA